MRCLEQKKTTKGSRNVRKWLVIWPYRRTSRHVPSRTTMPGNHRWRGRLVPEQKLVESENRESQKEKERVRKEKGAHRLEPYCENPFWVSKTYHLLAARHKARFLSRRENLACRPSHMRKWHCSIPLSLNVGLLANSILNSIYDSRGDELKLTFLLYIRVYSISPGRVKFILMRKGPVHSRESSHNFVLTELALGLVFSDMIFPWVTFLPINGLPCILSWLALCLATFFLLDSQIAEWKSFLIHFEE